jgi:energy-coupling factor transporter ATP-binding protein EcfA2
MDLVVGDVTLENMDLSNVHVILGKNGVGKSELLRKLDLNYSNEENTWFIKYISPERGGELIFDAATEQNLRAGDWAITSRRRNRVNQFRNMSFAEYRNLEVLVLRKIENDRSAPSFELIMDQVNALLDNVKIVRGSKADPELRQKKNNSVQSADKLSSGESELLSLAIEILSYVYQAEHSENADKRKLLLLDEPDVHLHPDLQHRLMALLVAATAGKNIATIIATHSTALLGALADKNAKVAFMGKESTILRFNSITQQLQDVIPIFGAHPLTNVFNANPVLLVEGEDDVRIWQQAVRSSVGRIKLWPCAAGDIQSLEKYESIAADIIGSVYDDAKAYSLRDRDNSPYEIDDRPHVTRLRLYCRTAENLILADDVLEMLGSSWPKFQESIMQWLKKNDDHPQSKSMTVFSNKFDRVEANVKELRNLFMAIIGSDKPWEVAIGQCIAALGPNSKRGVGSLIYMIGPKAVASLHLCSTQA